MLQSYRLLVWNICWITVMAIMDSDTEVIAERGRLTWGYYLGHTI